MIGSDGSAEPKQASSLVGGSAAAGLIHQGVRKNIEPPKTHLDIGGSLHGTNNAMRALTMNSHRTSAFCILFRLAPCACAERATKSLTESGTFFLAADFFLRAAWCLDLEFRLGGGAGLVLPFATCPPEQVCAQHA
jgi:hypothetical protein